MDKPEAYPTKGNEERTPDTGTAGLRPAGKLICAPICLQWFMRANWRRFGGTFLFNPAAPEIPLKHAPPLVMKSWWRAWWHRSASGERRERLSAFAVACMGRGRPDPWRERSFRCP